MPRLEDHIEERFQMLTPAAGYPADNDYPAPSNDPDHISNSIRVAASVPLINTEPSRSTDRANAIAKAVSELPMGERGDALPAALKAFEAADDDHRKMMVIAAVREVSDNPQSIRAQIASDATMRDGRVQAAYFLIEAARIAPPTLARVVDMLRRAPTLRPVFDRANEGCRRVEGLDARPSRNAHVRESERLQQSYWHNVEARADNERSRARSRAGGG